MAINLYEVKQYGRQIAENSIQVTQTAPDAVNVAASIINNVGFANLETEQFWLKVVYRDESFRPEERETSLWTYNDSNQTINRVGDPYSSSQGGLPVNWDQSQDLVIYSVAIENVITTTP